MSCAAALLVSCNSFKPNPAATIIPPPIVDVQPSFDGEKQNSGIIDYIEGKGFLISSDAAARYKELTKLLGSESIPALTEGQGLIPQEDGNFILPSSFMVEFAAMNEKFKSRPR